MKDRQWICINGRKLLGREFIQTLDIFRCCTQLYIRGEKTCRDYESMIFVIQEMTNDYMEGKDYIGDQLGDFFSRHYMELPEERKLPEAIEVLFTQMETKLRVDLTELLDRCVERTRREYERMQEEQRKEDKRLKVVRSLMKEKSIPEYINTEEDTVARINRFLKLQEIKYNSKLYDMTAEEINVTRLWCDLLVSSIYSDVISCGIMERIVENKLVSELEISQLLENKYNIDKDYEWYSEDFLGCEKDYPTKIRIKDVEELCKERIEKIVGATI